MCKDTQMAFESFSRVALTRAVRWVSWKPPEDGLFKLNSDGSVNEQGQAAAGGLLRNEMGAWIGMTTGRFRVRFSIKKH